MRLGYSPGWAGRMEQALDQLRERIARLED
jgi:hypothetical protein